ncbi:hypothetical protein [Streptomyces filamentosus]|uniref:hypothetical protein n=1 Tax=Streptomyces filamentosus TaxID=67294 RepID=UPI0033E32409
MPLRSPAKTLLALAATALQDLDVDPASLQVLVEGGEARITYASTGDPGADRSAAEQIKGEICIGQHRYDLDLLPPVVIRPADDDATLAAAADSLRQLATLLESARTDSVPDRPRQLDRRTALRVAENVLGSVG